MGLFERILFELGPWSWWVLGMALIALEVVVPGTFFLWFGIAALLVGVLALMVVLPWQVALGLFIFLALLNLIVGRRLLRRAEATAGDPHLNQRGSRYVGREFVLAEPMVQNSGRLSIDDTVWRITGPDLAAGTRVRVTRIDGAQLVVEPA
ncbi:NfeD family protein [Microvirga tunisiensis]|uniref:NfeD family protein n=2 Tax=Pannonibacter tanglangensis TaxID=2750084 RepID=A0ABW9ZLR4_9HYPH|nr:MULTISPECIES: NfeD family protein [unclassified Pannonibacter]NBN65319.1 NfeD family protein [Pannonibacter sp. XCT-34]NBN79704.1 NfeD family protein [Pannonibacter sp. XCT-53]